MSISIVHEHSVDLDLLPEEANILDLGCRGFEFADHFRRLGHNVRCVDIDHLEGNYDRVAITGFNGRCGIWRGNDPQGTKITAGNDIPCYTLETYLSMVTDGEFDLIKLDVEGSEYEIIMSLTKAPAKQLSIEFHLHTGAYTIFEMNEMENKLKELGYEFVQHEMSDRHAAGQNFWDSLFVKK